MDKDDMDEFLKEKGITGYITDDGTKKSAKGLLRVDKVDGVYVLKNQCTREEEAGGELRTLYKNGNFIIEQTFDHVRQTARI